MEQFYELTNLHQRRETRLHRCAKDIDVTHILGLILGGTGGESADAGGGFISLFGVIFIK